MSYETTVSYQTHDLTRHMSVFRIVKYLKVYFRSTGLRPPIRVNLHKSTKRPTEL